MQFSIIKIPFDKCIVEKDRRGTALGPDAIQNELNNFFEFEKLKKNVKFHAVKELNDFNKLHKEVQTIAEKEYSAKNFVIALGGDHSVSLGAMKAFASKHKKNGLIFIDAHLDCQDDFMPPTHEDILRAVIKERLFSEIIAIGTRNFTEKEKDFAESHKINFSNGIDYKKIMGLCKKVENIYVSLDIDAIEPAFAPGTGWPEPLGIFPQQLMTLLEFLKATKKVRGFDIVEVSPPKDVNNITSRLAARLLIEFLK